VKIPAGIGDGMRIRSPGIGELGINGGPNGDLYVEIHTKHHSVFKRNGDDLHCPMPIPFTTAAWWRD
jgi:molecular chaperone DnaJ